MALKPLTPDQEARFWDDRRPALYGSLISLLVLNNIFVVLRCIGRYRTKRAGQRRLAAEDPLIVLTGIFIDVIIANLLAATKYGLGLHTWRVLHDDPSYPSDLSNVFKHVWITMVLTGPVFCCIKLTLLFFYRRLFLINQRWLSIAWWANIAYVTLWVVGATGFYLFQCSPPQWYFLQYFMKYGKLAPGSPVGQCNATTTEHVSIPLILGLVQDFAILFLPVVALWHLSLSIKKRIGLIGVFAIGILACVLDLARIVQLLVNTDDKTDPAYGVAIFLILSAASEVAAVVCICLPVIIPWLWQEYRRARGTTSWEAYGYSSQSNTQSSRGQAGDRTSEFETRGVPPGGYYVNATPAAKPETDDSSQDLPLQDIGVATPYAPGGRIHVATEVEVTMESDSSWFQDGKVHEKR